MYSSNRSLHLLNGGNMEEIMNWPKMVVLVRHAQSTGNAALADGSFDVIKKSNISMNDLPLTEFGKEQAKITGKYLRKYYKSFNVYSTSPLVRALETSKLLYPDIQFQTNPFLNEVNEGIWEILTEKEIKQRYPEEIILKKKKGLYDHTPLWGKSYQEVENTMVRPFIIGLFLYCSNKNILIVGHGKWFEIFDGFVQRLTTQQKEANIKKFSFDNASVTRYEKSKSGLVLAEKNIVPWKGLI